MRRALEAGALAVLHKLVPVPELLQTLSILSARSSILVVEDDKDFTETLTHVLEEAGYKVHTATGRAEAQALLTRQGVELVLLDFRLAEGTVAELLA